MLKYYPKRRKRRRLEERTSSFMDEFEKEVINLLSLYNFLWDYEAGAIVFASDISERDKVQIFGLVDYEATEMEIEIAYLANTGALEFLDKEVIILRGNTVDSVLADIENGIINYINRFQRRVEVMNKLVDIHS